ncbi:MAG: hypothetical protein KJN89_00585, partial [Gammaproteobacteria bacterium]|nr:hypothetical protein [Gammaproteobacteria bacterium]NNJ48836.1 hypothetical protein [Gammaproteobacteria bacterium]
MSKITTRIGRVKTLYKDHLWQGRLIVATLITVLVLLIVRVSLPYTIIYSAVYWLEQQGITAQIEDITINISKGTFSVHGASGIQNETRVFNIGKVSVDWEWTPLKDKNIHITDVVLEDFILNAAQYMDAIEIAGILIKDDGTVEQQSTQEDDPVAWGAALNQIDFKDLRFCFQQFDSPFDEANQENNLLDYCAKIGQLSWQGDFSLGTADSSSQSPELQLAVDGTLEFKQVQLFNNRLEGALINIGDTSLSDIKINGINDIKLDSINIAELSLLQQSGHSRHTHAVEFSDLDISDISVSDLDTVTINAIELTKPVISMGRDETGKFKYEQWLLQQKQAASTTAQQSADQPGETTAFNINLGDIKIIEPEICYEQQASSSSNKSLALDYCLNLASSEWDGDLAITTPVDTKPLSLNLHGNLVLSSFSTTNNLLKRDLLNFDNLAIKNIAVNSLDDLAFARLNLDNAAGLELTSTEDKYTMTVSGLDVSAFSYRNNTLSIDMAAINDLGLEITQNKDGSLDFEQWKFTTDEQQATAQAEAAAGSSKPDAEPLRIKIGEFRLDTTRPVEFADLSVTPNMLVGLEEIHLIIKQLDSEKPEQKSP